MATGAHPRTPTAKSFGAWCKTDGHKTTASTAAPWVSFAEEDAPVALESTANTVDIKASASYRTVFKYDAAKGKYTRYYGNTIRKDYFTGETVDMKNVFILFTTIRNYSDNYHRQVMLESGDGYYCVNGTYTAIKWSKGAAKNGFKFTKADGSELTVNPGNSWVSIVNIGNDPHLQLISGFTDNQGARYINPRPL